MGQGDFRRQGTERLSGLAAADGRLVGDGEGELFVEGNRSIEAQVAGGIEKGIAVVDQPQHMAAIVIRHAALGAQMTAPVDRQGLCNGCRERHND